MSDEAKHVAAGIGLWVQNEITVGVIGIVIYLGLCAFLGWDPLNGP